MLTDVFLRSQTVERLRRAPGGVHLDEFAAWLLEQRYAKKTVAIYATNAAYFLRWLALNGRSAASVQHRDLETYRDFLVADDRWLFPERRSCLAYSAARRFAVFLAATGLATHTEPDAEAGESILVVRFRQWMRQHRGTMEVTLKNYSRYVQELVDAVGDDPSTYEVKALRRFVIRRAKRNGPTSAEAVVTSVRMFLRFLVAVDACPDAFRHAIPSMAKWRQSSLPRYLPAGEVERAVSSCDLSSSVGIRDRAVLLLLARLGLRGNDIAALSFADFHWEEGWLRVAGKGRREARLPLPQDVGEAVLRYLEAARPKSFSDHIFLLCRAPFSPIQPHVVSQIARRGLRRAGSEAASMGSNAFRHTLATTLLREGVALQDIAAVLRHHCIDTTLQYAKVDVARLAQVALPWPEVVPC